MQNYMGTNNLDADVFCTTAPQGGVIRNQIPEICNQLVPSNSTDLFISRACPASLGCYSNGVGVFEVQPLNVQPNGKSVNMPPPLPSLSLLPESSSSLLLSLSSLTNSILTYHTGQGKVVRKWARTDKTCGTSIPLISGGKDGSNTAYCVGATAGSSQWALLGMDLETGKETLYYQFYKEWGAKNLFVNPFYAGVEVSQSPFLFIHPMAAYLLTLFCYYYQ